MISTGAHAVVAALSALALTFAGHPPAGELISGEAQDDTISIGGHRDAPGAAASVPARPAGSSSVVTSCVPMEDGFLRCYSVDESDPDGYIMARTVRPDEVGGPGVVELRAGVERELHRLSLVSGGIEVQPSRGWTLVNVETIVLTDPTPQEFAVTVLDVPLVVRAEPVAYEWDFGDGSPVLVTRDPGARWPDQTVTHTYRSTGSHAITLQTRWSGAFRLESGQEWFPVDGTAVTVASTSPLDVHEARNRLVPAPSS